VAVAQLSFHEGVGAHRTVVVDISTRSMIGQQEYKVVRPTARRLVTRNKACLHKYLEDVTRQFWTHWLVEQQQMVVTTLSSDEITPDQVLAMEQINVQKTEIQRGAEKCCRTFKIAACLSVLPFATYTN
jgi:hypothetical protein